MGGATIAFSEQYVLRKFHGQNHLQCFKDKNISQLNTTDNERINVTLRRARASTVTGEKPTCYIFRVCVCSLSYPACKTHAPYYIVTCGLCGCTMCCNIISYTARFSGEKKVTEHKILCVLIFSTAFV